MSYQISELERRMASMMRVGTIEAVDHKAARCRVKVGEWVSAWLPWSGSAAGQVRNWRPPSVGEQAMILSPSGLPEGGFVMSGLYTTQHQEANDDRQEMTATDWPDGARWSYDHKKHDWRLDVPEGGSITIKIGKTELVLKNSGVTLKTPEFKGEQA